MRGRKIGYKGVPGGADLTDIGTAWMIEKLHEVFGPSGLGWRLVYDPADLEFVGLGDKRPWAILKTAQFQYALIDETGATTWYSIQCNGGSQNEPHYALKGAMTSALGTALSQLLWQLPVYKGVLNHHNAGKLLGKNGNGNGSSDQTDEPSGDKPVASASKPTAPAKPTSVKPAPKPATAAALAQPALAKPAKPVATTALAKPEANDNGNGNGSKPATQPQPQPQPGDFVIPFGPHKGKTLAAIDPKLVEFYARKLVVSTPETQALKTAAQAFLQAAEPAA